MLKTTPIETVILNGRIYTMSAPGEMIEALAISGGRIVATGSTADILAYAPGAQVIDLEGRTAIPGIIDSHCHPDMTGVRLGKWHNFAASAPNTRASILAFVRERAASLAPGQWIVGSNFDDLRDGGYPSREELDTASGGRPVFIYRRCAQIGIANSSALAAVGFDLAIEDPPHGSIERDATGRPNGKLHARAAHVVIDHIHAGYTKDDFREGLIQVFDHYLSFGITSIHNSLTQGEAIRAYQDMRDRGELNLRVGMLVTGRDPELMEAVLRSGLRSGLGDEWVKLIGVEWVCDGSTSGRSAAYFTPYIGTPLKDEPEGHCGTLLMDPPAHKAIVKRALEAGMIVCTDAMGDRGIAEVIKVYEEVLSELPSADHRMRIEHCCAVTPDNLAGLKRNKIMCSSAAGFAWDLGDAHIAARGSEAMADFWPHRAMIDAGVKAPAHSDAPVCNANPFTAISALVNRRTISGASLDASQAISVYEALEAYTTLGAYAGREETLKGQIQPGMLGDLCVLDRDPFAIDKAMIDEVRVELTIVGGVVKFSRL